MLRIDHLHLQAGSFRVDDVSLAVDDGEYFVLMGATGSGKSLLIKAICGLLRPESGSLTIGGHDVTSSEPRRRSIGYLPQDCALFPHLDVARNIAFAGRAHGLSHRKAMAAAGQLIELLNLGSLIDRRSDTLSGGERQKVALVRALAAQPQLLILDEPLSALDEPTRREIALELRRVQRRLKIATVHVCHNLQEAEAVADRVGIMSAGRLAQVGTLDALRTTPANAAVARIMGIDQSSG